jgi:peptidoglycan hydrolase-like protein with peptidoglycan-binding domain
MNITKRIAPKLLVSLAAAACLGTVAAAPAQANVHAPTLSIGSTGSGVWCVQRILNRDYHWGLTEDSIYGQHTADAVSVFQSRHQIRADGIVGPITGSYLLDSVQGDAYCDDYLPTVN